MSKTDKICRRSINFITISKPINNLSPVYFILLGFYPFDREMDDIHYGIPFPPANSHEYNLFVNLSPQIELQSHFVHVNFLFQLRFSCRFRNALHNKRVSENTSIYKPLSIIICIWMSPDLDSTHWSVMQF